MHWICVYLSSIQLNSTFKVTSAVFSTLYDTTEVCKNCRLSRNLLTYEQMTTNNNLTVQGNNGRTLQIKLWLSGPHTSR